MAKQPPFEPDRIDPQSPPETPPIIPDPQPPAPDETVPLRPDIDEPGTHPREWPDK